MSASADRPVSAAFTRLVFFTAVVPYVRLRERLDRRVAIHPEFNDVCIAAADLSVACYHLPEHLDDEFPEIAARVRAIAEFKAIGDIANTRKHVRRKVASRTVKLRASLTFELGPEGGHRFIATDVYANCDAWTHEVNVSALLAQFINSVCQVTGALPNVSVSPHYTINGEFLPKVRCILGPESFGMERTDLRIVRLSSSGELEPAPSDHNFDLELEVEPEQQARHGHHVLTFDVQGARAWLDDIAVTDSEEQE